MKIMNLKKRTIIILLIIGIVAVLPGCVRYSGEHEPEPGEENYQLEITVEVAGEINTDDGIYYIVLDNNGNSADGPGDDISSWDDRFYYIKLEDGFFDFAQVEDGFESTFDGGSFSGDKIQTTIALSDLEDPSSVDINVVTTDSDNNTYDYLDPYFTINTDFGSSKNITDTEGDSGDSGADFDIVSVTAVITTLY